MYILAQVKKKRIATEGELSILAKTFREAAGKTRTEAARELGVARSSVHQAEELPEKGLFNLRKRIIETYSANKVTGPVYIIEPSDSRE